MKKINMSWGLEGIPHLGKGCDVSNLWPSEKISFVSLDIHMFNNSYLVISERKFESSEKIEWFNQKYI
jgi:hypothetical protein